MSDNDEWRWRKLDDREVERLFSHGLHEDGVFNDRLNFFLVFESVLLATFATLYARDRDISAALLVALATVGIFITMLWAFVQRHQRLMLKVLVNRARQNVREYDETKRMVDELRGWSVSSLSIMTYAIPAAVLAMWILLAILGATRMPKVNGAVAPAHSQQPHTPP